MSADSFTIFSKTVPVGVRCIVFYDGRFDGIEAAKASGEPSYRVYVKYSDMIISTVEIDMDDDATIVGGVASNIKTSDHTEGTGVVDMRTKRSARVEVGGKMYKFEQRVTQLGWKFKSADGTEYKWDTPISGNQWELQDKKGSVVATLNLRKSHPEILEIGSKIDKSLRVLIFSALVFSIVTVASDEPHYVNVLQKMLGGWK